MASLRNKRDQLRLVLRGEVNDHHRFLLAEQMERIETQIHRLESRIAEQMKPHQTAIEHLNTIPGLDWINAWTVLAELGEDMSVFADEHHAASWGWPGAGQL